MAHRPKYFPLTALLATVLATAIGLLVLAPSAAARVSIVPGAVKGGGTETFAFRLANERSDTSSNRLELVFPQNPPIAFAEVAAVRGWTATITPRPLNPPITVGGRVISEVVGSIVLEGGPVRPGQFEQFLITMGPLPADGQMVFEATQNYTNGAVERYTNAPGQTTPGAPMITIGAGNVPGAPPAPPPPAAGQGNGESAPADQSNANGTTGGGLSTLTLLWGGLGLGALIVALVGLRTYVRGRRPPVPDAGHTDKSDVADEPGRADAAEVDSR
jgi:periplasmic copper chaperone A